MSWISAAAIFFIIWWMVLFAMLPLGLRTQEEDDNVTLGTVPSAPGRPHMLKVVVRTSIVSLLVFGIFYFITKVLGLGFGDIPIFVPKLN